MIRPLSLAEADLFLHDAVLRPSSIRAEGDALRIDGTLERPVGRTMGRFPCSLNFDRVSSFEVDDEAGIDQVMVGDLRRQGDEVVITGPLPGSVTVTTPLNDIEISVESEPIAIRRLFRWRPVHG